MKVVIMGCGRTGSLLATMLEADGHRVTLIDWSDSAFQRLPDQFTGQTILGNAVDQDVLVEAGIRDADAFVACTSGDNRNVMASEIARFVFGVPRVVSRIKDPSRAAIYSDAGIQVDCRTTEAADFLLDAIGA